MTVAADLITNPGMHNYQNFVYDNFNWATIGNALKWRLMEWTQVSSAKCHVFPVVSHSVHPPVRT